MNNELREKYKDIPDALPDSIVMTEASDVLVIYEGEYVIKCKTGKIKMNGRITYEWFPESGVYFHGFSTSNGMELFDLSLSPDNNNLSIVVDAIEFGKGFIMKSRVGGGSGVRIKGRIFQQAILGDTTIPAEKVRFSIPNFLDFSGMPVKRVTEGGVSVSRDRIVLEDKTYKVTIDKCSDFRERKEKLKENGGYLILYNGELIGKKKPLNCKDVQKLLSCLSVFLSFLNGRRTSALFAQGIYAEQTIWTDYTSYLVGLYRDVSSWARIDLNKDNLNDLWNSFRRIWNNSSDDEDFLRVLISWYVEANDQTGFLEKAIVLAQTALELVYNWWVVEHKKLILGNDSRNISASNKIRLLISQLNISSSIPDAFTELQNLKDETNSISSDAPGSIVYIRNSIAHSREERRKELSSIGYKAKYQALQLYLWYIELSLLSIFDYRGEYFNRCSKQICKI